MSLMLEIIKDAKEHKWHYGRKRLFLLLIRASDDSEILLTATAEHEPHACP